MLKSNVWFIVFGKTSGLYWQAIHPGCLGSGLQNWSGTWKRAVREGGSKSFVICFSSSDTMPERSLAEPHRTRPFHNPGILDLSTFYVPENNQKYNADPDAYSEKKEPGCYRRDERNCKTHIHCTSSFLSYRYHLIIFFYYLHTWELPPRWSEMFLQTSARFLPDVFQLKIRARLAL